MLFWIGEALLRPGGRGHERRRRLREYQQAVDTTFVKPLLERAAQEMDPHKRSRLGGLAAVNRLLHPAVELYAARLEREITKAGLHSDGGTLGAPSHRRSAD